jgi:hypothetical protein
VLKHGVDLEQMCHDLISMAAKITYIKFGDRPGLEELIGYVVRLYPLVVEKQIKEELDEANP